MAQQRHPKGTPGSIGGRFAPNTHSQAEQDLDFGTLPPPFNIDRPNIEPGLLAAHELSYQPGSLADPEFGERLYGESGLTREATRVLLPNVDQRLLRFGDVPGQYPRPGCPLPEHYHVKNIDSGTAARLRETLPETQMGDRQNDSPTMDCLLTLCENHPEVSLEGYVIGPPRYDERVTIDGLLVDNETLNVDEDEEDMDFVWREVKNRYALDELGMPDEIEHVDTGKCLAWRFWWD